MLFIGGSWINDFAKSFAEFLESTGESEHLENGNTVQCSILILIKCINPNENGLCVYDLELDVENVPLLMQPKEIYYGI